MYLSVLDSEFTIRFMVHDTNVASSIIYTTVIYTNNDWKVPGFLFIAWLTNQSKIHMLSVPYSPCVIYSNYNWKVPLSIHDSIFGPRFGVYDSRYSPQFKYCQFLIQRKLRWYVNSECSSGMANIMLQGTVEGIRKREKVDKKIGRQV